MSRAISIDNLGFRYRRGSQIVEGLTWSIASGEVLAITGSSGRGKSTLLYLVGLLLSPTSGRILVHSDDTSRLTDRERSLIRAERMGFVFQDAALDHTRSVLDNVIEPYLYRSQSLRDARMSAMQLLEEFGIESRAHHRPGQVSGGQAARISLCRALLSNPPILLADEPTGNLDDETARAVIRALRQRSFQGTAVVIATHDARVVQAADAVLRL